MSGQDGRVESSWPLYWGASVAPMDGKSYWGACKTGEWIRLKQLQCSVWAEGYNKSKSFGPLRWEYVLHLLLRVFRVERKYVDPGTGGALRRSKTGPGYLIPSLRVRCTVPCAGQKVTPPLERDTRRWTGQPTVGQPRHQALVTARPRL